MDRNKPTKISFNKVKKYYPGGIMALNDITFDINNGEFTFIVGPSGAGKTTIVRLLIRQEFPSEGDILFENLEVTKIPRNLLSFYRQKLGIVFQDLKLIDSKTVKENIQFALEINKKNTKEIEETTNYLLEVVNLKGRSHLFPEELSGGEKQRVAIARALANDPKLFIADEPTGNLDPNNAMDILNILKTINSWGTTVLVITHDEDIVDIMQQRVIHMENGKIVADEKGGYQSKAIPKQTPMKKLSKKNLFDSSIDKYIKDKATKKVLRKIKIEDMELLLNITEQDFEKIALNKKRKQDLEEAIKNYLSEKSDE